MEIVHIQQIRRRLPILNLLRQAVLKIFRQLALSRPKLLQLIQYHPRRSGCHVAIRIQSDVSENLRNIDWFSGIGGLVNGKCDVEHGSVVFREDIG